MKKIIFYLFCTLVSFFAFSEELTSFMGIDFGTSKAEAIKIMETNGWTAANEEALNVTFSNQNGYYLGMTTKSVILSFNERQRLFVGGTMLIALTPENTDEVFSFYKKIQNKYEVQRSERSDEFGMAILTMYTKANDRILFTLGPGICSVTFGINENGLIAKKRHNNYKFSDWLLGNTVCSFLGDTNYLSRR